MSDPKLCEFTGLEFFTGLLIGLALVAPIWALLVALFAL